MTCDWLATRQIDAFMVALLSPDTVNRTLLTGDCRPVRLGCWLTRDQTDRRLNGRLTAAWYCQQDFVDRRLWHEDSSDRRMWHEGFLCDSCFFWQLLLSEYNERPCIQIFIFKFCPHSHPLPARSVVFVWLSTDCNVRELPRAWLICLLQFILYYLLTQIPR